MDGRRVIGRATILRRRTAVGLNRTTLLLVGLLTAVAILLAPVAQASSGRVMPQGQHQRPGQPLRAFPRLAGAAPVYDLWDAQPGGALISVWDSKVTLNATDATGKTVWSVAGQDVWTASGVLPAGLAAVYNNPDPNVLRSGKLVAYRADGSLRFKKTFKNAFVMPLCDTATRLVWVEVSARRVVRVFVRQGGVTRSLVLPYGLRRAGFPSPVGCSVNGASLAVGTRVLGTNAWRDLVSWIRVDRHGVPQVVSQKITGWVDVTLSPGGAWAAATTQTGHNNVWLRFGQFTGRLLPGEDTGVMAIGRYSIFELGEYSYSNDTTSWGTTTVEVVDRPYLRPIYQRAWATDGQQSIWFDTDPEIGWLVTLDATPGSMTVINVTTWDAVSVPTTSIAAIPVRGGKIATLTDTGALAYIANPVPNP